KSSRLYKKLIYDMQIAKSVHAVKYQLEDGGLFIFRVELMAGGNPDLVENVIYEEINDIIDNGFTDYEYEKIRNGIEFYNTTTLSTMQKIGMEILFDKMLYSDVDLINRKSAKYLSYSKEEILASITKWFKNRNKFVMKYIPRGIQK